MKVASLWIDMAPRVGAVHRVLRSGLDVGSIVLVQSSLDWRRSRVEASTGWICPGWPRIELEHPEGG